MSLNHISKFPFSRVSYPKTYDLVCIGPSACTAGSRVFSRLNMPELRTYFVNDCIEQFLPILVPTHHDPSSQRQQPFLNKVNTITKYPPNANLGSGVKHIYPQHSRIVMHSGEQLKYKELIFSGNTSDWKKSDLYQGLSEAVSTPYTAVYGDGQYHCRNLHQLYHRNNGSANGGDIIFSVPKSTHFGYENYFMMHLLDSVKYRSQKLKLRKNTKITVFLEGEKFFPLSEEHQIYLRKRIMSDYPQIKIINNSQITNLNFRKRRVTVNGTSYPYQAFYQYMAVKVPTLLTKSKIDPFEVSRQTLRHRQYPNISILGNNLSQSPFSFYSMNVRTHSIVENVCYSLLNSKKMALYDGTSVIPLWTNRSQVVYLSMNYQKSRNPEQNFFTNNALTRKILGWDRKLLGRLEIEFFMRGLGYGFPYYFVQPHLKTVLKNQPSYVPAIIQKDINRQ